MLIASQTTSLGIDVLYFDLPHAADQYEYRRYYGSHSLLKVVLSVLVSSVGESQPPKVARLIVLSHVVLSCYYVDVVSIEGFVGVSSFSLSLVLSQFRTVRYVAVLGAAQTWQDLTGREIKYMNIDVAKEYELLLQLFKDYKPDTVSPSPLSAERCYDSVRAYNVRWGSHGNNKRFLYYRPEWCTGV